jgi:predicted RNA-binding Zn ribbon-like protein
VHLDGHTIAIVRQAVALMNALVPGQDRGRQHRLGTGDDLRAQVQAAIPPGDDHTVTAAEADRLAAIAAELYGAVAAHSAGDVDTAAERINEMIHRYDGRPTLLRHGAGPWHLHFHGPQASYVDAVGGGQATALAFVFGSEQSNRLGICSAPECDRVYLDDSRNATRRFCCTTCQNRVKVAAFRARRAVDG